MKEDILNYLKKINVLYTIANVVLILSTIVCVLFITIPPHSIFLMLVAAILIVLNVFLRIKYNLSVSMGVVYEISVSGNTLSFKTKKVTYSYDLDKTICDNIQIENNKFVCTFVRGNEKDKLTFYRYLPFSNFRNEQFTKEEIAFFCPKDAFSKIRS